MDEFWILSVTTAIRSSRHVASLIVSTCPQANRQRELICCFATCFAPNFAYFRTYRLNPHS